MEYVIFAIAMALLVMFFLGKGYYDFKKSEKRFIQRLYSEYGQIKEKEYKPGQFEKIARYFEKHQSGYVIDDITWNDLNMDEIYKRINFTYSAAGEEYLYYILRTPCLTKQGLSHTEEMIQYFREHQEERVALQFIFSKLGRSGKFSIHDYLDNLDSLGERRNTKHFIAILLIFVSICLLWVNISAGIIVLIAVLIANNISYFKEKGEIDPYITSFAYIFRLLETVNRVKAKKIDVISEEILILKNSSNALNNFKRGSFLLMSGGRAQGSGNPLELFMDFIRMGFHLDLMKFNQMLSQVRKHTTDIDDMITTLGKIEAMIAIGEYRESLESYCVPVFEEKEYLCIREMYHPLIDHPVKNDIETSNGVLITGSNASGKSTFLKTVALNCIFAQTIHTCLAEYYSGALFRISSSMSLRDDVMGGESYYMVEIKALKRILDMLKQADEPVLCFVDEVLRGTNTVERIAASTQILKSLTGKGCICFAATHDIELTHILEDDYTNYHFSEEIEDDDISFSYKLLDGRATTRNAIKLLGIMGYEADIIQNADKVAENFLKTGSWS